MNAGQFVNVLAAIDADEFFHVLEAIGFGIFAFVVNWRRMDDATEMGKLSDAARRFLSVDSVKSIDGRVRYRVAPFHLRVAISLICALIITILALLWP